MTLYFLVRIANLAVQWLQLNFCEFNFVYFVMYMPIGLCHCAVIVFVYHVFLYRISPAIIPH